MTSVMDNKMQQLTNIRYVIAQEPKDNNTNITIGVQANFFKGAEPSLPENFFDSSQKAATLTCNITLPDSRHPVIISKNPVLWALYFARQNEFRFLFNKYENFFSFLAVGF